MTNPFIHAITLALPLLITERQALIESCSKQRRNPETGEWEVMPDTLDPEDAPYVARFDEAIAACQSALRKCPVITDGSTEVFSLQPAPDGTLRLVEPDDTARTLGAAAVARSGAGEGE